MIAPYTSVTWTHRPCTSQLDSISTIPLTYCAAGSLKGVHTRRLSELAGRAAAAAHESADPEAMHVTALIDLIWGSGAGKSLQRSISFLEGAAARAERPATVLADLAAAHLVRAERLQTPRDLLMAAEAAERALEYEPGHPAARFNLALALDRFGLDAQALQAWHAFLEVDSRSGWAGEARERVAVLAGPSPRPASPLPGATAAALAAYAAATPQEARLLGWDRVLGEWGTAVLDGDAVRATERLHTAGVLGEALERRGGDRTLADAVRVIRAKAGDPAATRALARAHRAYVDGQVATDAVEHAAAWERFAEVLALAPPSSTLRGWARLYRAGMDVHAGRLEKADRDLAHLAATTDAARYPALRGRARSVQATVRLRMGRYEQALVAAMEAGELLGRAGEHDHVAGTLYLMTDIHNALGATVAAHASAHRALLVLRGGPASPRQVNSLAAAARVAAADGLLQAAVRIQDERAAVAGRIGQPVYVAEARLARAELLVALGDTNRADADLRTGEALARRIKAPDARRWIEADLRLARAGRELRTTPARAVAALHSLVGHPAGPRPAIRVLQARVTRAEARLALGDMNGAAADLEQAAAMLDAQRAAIASAPMRSALLDAAHGVFERMALLRLTEGDTAGALGYLERGRSSFAVGAGAAEPPLARWRIPPGRVALEYALIGDTLLTWTVRDTTVHLIRATVRRSDLLERVEQARSALELRLDESAIRTALAALYDLLVRPVRGRLGGTGTELVIVADGEISGIPFAALFDRERQRYVVEDHAVRFAARLREAGLEPARREAPLRALLVADPAFDTVAHPGLERLPGARDEVRVLAALYPAGTRVEGPAADRATLEGAIRRAEVLHFAGHAVLDEQRPERSHLVLAPDRGGHGGRWSAAEVSGTDLSGVRLVVLSACQTMGATGGRSGGFAGFAGALLGAGAGGVVGSVWRVDDRLTAALMPEFHRAYRDSGDGAAALRTAQLRMLRSRDEALRSPAAWAGFRYAGR